jgi:hypothetical protein
MTPMKHIAAAGRAATVTPCPQSPSLVSVPWKKMINAKIKAVKNKCATTQCSVE